MRGSYLHSAISLSQLKSEHQDVIEAAILIPLPPELLDEPLNLILPDSQLPGLARTVSFQLLPSAFEYVSALLFGYPLRFPEQLRWQGIRRGRESTWRVSLLSPPGYLVLQIDGCVAITQLLDRALLLLHLRSPPLSPSKTPLGS